MRQVAKGTLHSVTTPSSINASAVQLINQIIADAVEQNASDIHFEPHEQAYRVRYRIDGILYTQHTLPSHLADALTIRLKVMMDLDISERRLPQDGHCKLSQPLPIELRASTCPTLYGEKIVLRILSQQTIQLSIEQLGFDKNQQTAFLQAMQQPQGMILVTGPTGSGKTITLYTALQLLNTEEINILSIEDPVEINLPGINQTNINRKTGLDFSYALRSFLRQDPDIIMVGEMRDQETAEMAIKAAQTGHLVFSTLHNNTAAESITRLLNMGIKTFNLATTIKLIVAQRLVRTLCIHCKKPTHDSQQPYSTQGCMHCTNGYKGRTGLFEVLPISQAISQLILNRKNATDITAQARSEHVTSLYQAGVEKVQQGITQLTEVNRVI